MITFHRFEKDINISVGSLLQIEESCYIFLGKNLRNYEVFYGIETGIFWEIDINFHSLHNVKVLVK